MIDDDYDIDSVDDDDNDSVYEPIDNYKKGDIVFAWYCQEKNNMDTATSWWPATIIDEENLRFFYELYTYKFICLIF